ncbi:MAG TPA: hypothetical protein DIW31_07520 [Bacteroidales bacterium]|nr:hypothetical protein [Bacteroidales bacterium]
MIFKRYQFGFLIRVILLALSFALLMYLVVVEKQYLRGIYVFAAIILLIWSIYSHISKISRDFFTFITALANEEYSIQFADDKSNKALQRLYHLYNITAKRFQKVKYERDLQHLFLQEIINQIEVGILAFNSNLDVLLYNKTYCKLFGLTSPKSLNDLNPEIKKLIIDLEPGNKRMIYHSLNGEKFMLSTHSTTFVLKERSLTLAYFHNIKSELDEQELESWQKLFSVLTHEIMNSVTPISSLTSSLNVRLKKDIANTGNAEQKTLTLLSEGLDAVSTRSNGLLTFTDSFRKLSKIAKPNRVEIELEKLFERIKTLFSSTLQGSSIKLKYEISAETPLIYADPQQIEQVLINLVQNAIDSLEGVNNGEISISTTISNGGKTTISISDNGIGIPSETIDKVFIPFFTTKAKGSGIGLSLSRQIVKMHNGTIEINSVKDTGTTVSIKI